MTEPPRPQVPPVIHDTASEWLARRNDHPGPETERAFRAWLAADVRHRLAYEAADRTWRDSKGLGATETGRTRALARAPFHMRHSTHIGAISIGILAVVGSFAYALLPYAPPFDLISRAEAATYQTRIGEIRSFRLPDGTLLTLDTASRVHVAGNAGERRVVLEQGRARFQVMAATDKPFTVFLPGGWIAARSALFDVGLAGGTATLSAWEGAIEWHPSEPARHAMVQLRAGQTVRTSPDAVPGPNVAEGERWVTGMLALDNTPLADAIAAINRYNALQIELADQRLGKLTATGAFNARDPAGFAQAIGRLFGLSLDRPSSDRIVLGGRGQQNLSRGMQKPGG